MLLIFISSSLGSCKKNDPVEISKKEILTKTKWNWIKTEEYNGDELVSERDRTGFKVNFNTDHSFEIENPGGEIIYLYHWDLSMDETNIYIIIKGNKGTRFFIEKLTENELIIYTTEEGEGSIVENPDNEIKKTIITGLYKSVLYFSR
jgi:hypothetical protein